MAGLGFILAFVGIILLISTLIATAKVRSFSRCSESITGRVGNKHVHHSNNLRHYSMEIEYTVDGNEYKRSVSASLSEYDTLEAGDPFKVRYKPDNPKKIIRADSLSEQSSKNGQILLLIGVAMTMIGIALILVQIITVRR